MSRMAEWIGARKPEPPMSLEPWLDGDDRPVSAEHLDAAGRAGLERVLAAPGRVRESAFDLLAADALLSYACEAALESDDPDGCLMGILDRVVTER